MAEEKKEYKFTNMILDLFNQKVTKLNDQFGDYLDFEIVSKGTKQVTAKTALDMIQNLDCLPVTDKDFYPFRECQFDMIPVFARKEFVETFLWCKNMFEPSVPTTESLAHAKELVDIHYVPTTKEDQTILNILRDGDWWGDYLSEYDLDWIFVAAKDEYLNTEFADLYENSGVMMKEVIVTDYLCRHYDLVIVLEELKSLRKRIRDTFMLGSQSNVGF
ncbi:MAG: hypothetical protein IJL21_00920 [Alphaproteobacteria bacterium]|nr:hypothetical protein [Alphaproteobacteria bacterium]